MADIRENDDERKAGSKSSSRGRVVLRNLVEDSVELELLQGLALIRQYGVRMGVVQRRKPDSKPPW